MRLGIKTHWRDVEAMVALARKHGATAASEEQAARSLFPGGVKVLEYQMLPGDLEHNAEQAMEAFLPFRGEFELRVHQPEGYHHEGAVRFLDPASPDEAERARSTQVLGEVARHAMELRAKALIAHPGGIWRGNVGGSSDLLRESLQDLPKHVKVYLENMPWLYHMEKLGMPDGVSPAAFRLPHGLARVDDLVDGYTFDISHAYLAVEKGTLEVPRLFARELGARIKHVHANGSRGGVGALGEGTPFVDSDYGAQFVRELLAALPDDVVVVPEIMDGHLDGGRLFDDGLAFLRGLAR